MEKEDIESAIKHYIFMCYPELAENYDISMPIQKHLLIKAEYDYNQTDD